MKYLIITIFMSALGVCLSQPVLSCELEGASPAIESMDLAEANTPHTLEELITAREQERINVRILMDVEDETTTTEGTDYEASGTGL